MKGCLVITLEPPYIGFVEEGRAQDCTRYFGRRSSNEEIKNFLQDRGVSIGRRWPIAEYVARVPCNLSHDELKKLNLS